MAHLIIKSEARHQGILALGRLIASGRVSLCANPLRDSDRITGFVPYQSIRFRDFEFTADHDGSLFLTGASVLPGDLVSPAGPAIAPLLGSFGEFDLNADLVSEENPRLFAERPSLVVSATIKEAQLCDPNPISVQAYPEIIREIGSPGLDLSDQFQGLELADRMDGSLDLTVRSSEIREFCFPPATHLVATVDDLTDTLDFDFDGINDMLGEAEDSLFPTSPVVPTSTGKWTANDPQAHGVQL
jgi:hypothetical protein